MKFNRSFKAGALSLRAVMVRVSCCVKRLGMTAAILTLCQSAPADTAVSVGPAGLAIAFSNADVSQGWRFSVLEPIQITALGLLDADEDGFQTEHPVAIWDAAGEMLAFALLEAGKAHPLIDRFRYADLETDGPVILSPGEDYTIGYFLPGDAFEDAYVVWNDVHEMHPSIMQVDARVFSLGGDFQMPETADPLGSQCFGPGFQFTVVPGPSAAMLFAIACPRSKRRRL